MYKLCHSPVKENREDSGSVHSLDLPSNKQSDHYGSDSVSLSSTDLNGSEINGGGTGVVSAESKSLDSLDLKNDAADSEHSYSAKDGEGFYIKYRSDVDPARDIENKNQVLCLCIRQS